MNEILQQLGMTYKEFSEHYEIPYNTVRQWAQGLRKPPKYVLKLLNEKIERESKGEQLKIQLGNKEYTKEKVEKIIEKIEWAIVDNTYPYFDKDGKAVNIWKAYKGFETIEEITKKISINVHEITNTIEVN